MSKRKEDPFHSLVLRQVKRSRDMFVLSQGQQPEGDEEAKRARVEVKRRLEYGMLDLSTDTSAVPAPAPKAIAGPGASTALIEAPPASAQALTRHLEGKSAAKGVADITSIPGGKDEKLQVLPVPASVLRAQQQQRTAAPQWHAPWKLSKVIAGHMGWVRTVCVDWSNDWFASGGDDKMIKIWDLASGKLKLTLPGHIGAITQLCVSNRSPYLFSSGDDKLVKCWDLEVNKSIRQYHGHLSGVYAMALHPVLDILFTGGRDASVRAWDIRMKKEIHTMTGHNHTIQSLVAQKHNPQVISGSQDNTIRLWDLVKGASVRTLTNHKKGVRSLLVHPTEYTFASGAADNVKKWKCPDGEFMQNFSGHNTIVNGIAVNEDNVLVSGGDNGTMKFWDWTTGHCFQSVDTIAQPGSLDAESAIFCTTFDHSGTRLLTGEADKTIKIWKEDESATPESHPVRFKPELNPKKY